MVGVMIGYQAALDLGKHTGMTKASCGIVFGVNLGSVQVVGCQCRCDSERKSYLYAVLT